MSAYEHPPGHPQAVIDGCLCSDTDNMHGRGSAYVDNLGNPIYWTNGDCPLHGLLADKPEGFFECSQDQLLYHEL